MSKKRRILPIWLFWTVYAAVIAVCIALDQLSKYFLQRYFEQGGRPIRIIGDWLTIVWTTNDGATGGMFSDLEWRNWLFFFMTAIGCPVFGWLLWRSRTRSVFGQIAFSFIIGGTIGNAIDRLAFAREGFFTGEVRDFVQVEGFFGIFNIADSFLVVGVFLALFTIIFFDPDSLLNTIREERRARLDKAASAEDAPGEGADKRAEADASGSDETTVEEDASVSDEATDGQEDEHRTDL